jgi:hypothetical protein
LTSLIETQTAEMGMPQRIDSSCFSPEELLRTTRNSEKLQQIQAGQQIGF